VIKAVLQHFQCAFGDFRKRVEDGRWPRARTHPSVTGRKKPVGAAGKVKVCHFIFQRSQGERFTRHQKNNAWFRFWIFSGHCWPPLSIVMGWAAKIRWRVTAGSVRYRTDVAIVILETGR
jgi:hypothetical protein